MQTGPTTHNDIRTEWLSQLGQRLNIPELAFDEAGLCQMGLNDEMMATIFRPSESEDLVVFGQLPIENISTELMQQMLKENRNHVNQTAPVLSLSNNLDALEVHLKLPQSELQGVDDLMGSLIGYLEHWRTQLNSTSAQ